MIAIIICFGKQALQRKQLLTRMKNDQPGGMSIIPYAGSVR